MYGEDKMFTTLSSSIDEESRSRIHIYVTEGGIRIENNGGERIDHVRVYDQMGKVVYSKSNPKEDELIMMQVSRAVYYVEVITSKKKFFEKVSFF